MTTTVQNIEGSICGDCLYTNEYGITEDNSSEEAQVSLRNIKEWSEQGQLVLDHQESTEHFGEHCICCGEDNPAGSRYEGSLTVFSQ